MYHPNVNGEMGLFFSFVYFWLGGPPVLLVCPRIMSFLPC